MNEDSPTLCPCCKQPFVPSGVSVDLHTNSLIANGQVIPLLPRLAEVAFILAKRMPEWVGHEVIIAQRWGNRSTEWAQTNLRATMPALRKAIRPAGLLIENSYGSGYRMVSAA
jgi:DNA-binding winged helix-turn-helix (wHTH) protein